jgi:hypothetical protein
MWEECLPKYEPVVTNLTQARDEKIWMNVHKRMQARGWVASHPTFIAMLCIAVLVNAVPAAFAANVDDGSANMHQKTPWGMHVLLNLGAESCGGGCSCGWGVCCLSGCSGVCCRSRSNCCNGGYSCCTSSNDDDDDSGLSGGAVAGIISGSIWVYFPLGGM